MGPADDEHRGRERALRERAQWYEALFEQSIDGIYLHDLDGRILDVNPSALAQSGYSKEELLRMSVFDFITDELPRDAIVAQWRAWDPGHAVLIEGHHRRKDGAILPVEINTGKVRIGDAEMMLAITRDITERRRAEELREKLEEQLRHAQKMEAVGRLAGGVAHDFNNVLCAISANAELGLANVPAGDPLHRSLDAIIAASDRAAGLTRQLLAFSRKQITAPRVIDMNELIVGMRPLIGRLLGEDVILRTVAAQPLGRVRVDRTQVEQVLLNLAVNSRDAMPEGGELLIETADISLDEAYCAAHANTEAGEYVMLAVSDTGSGIDADTLTKIFDPFFTTKEQGKGTGLGLATVHGIVEQSGGRIEVYSEPGQGTSFKIYFPRVEEEVEVQRRPPSRVLRRGTETVLVVEDEEMVREVAVRILSRCGYEVLAASSGAEALERAAQREGPIHLLLTDVVMPHMNGRELAGRLTELRPGLRVLYTSGYTASVIGHHGVLDEGEHFLPKPYSMDSLTARVREVLEEPAE